VTRRLGNWRAYRGVSHTCPTCQRAAHALSRARAPQPPAFNAVVGLASHGRLESSRHVAAPDQQALPQGHVAAPDLLPGGMGGLGPLAGPGAQAPWGSGFFTWGPRTTPRWSGLVTAVPEHLYPCGHVEAPDLLVRGGRSGDRAPSHQARAVRPVAQKLSAWLRVTDNLALLGLDTAVGGISVCMYRQQSCGLFFIQCMYGLHPPAASTFGLHFFIIVIYACLRASYTCSLFRKGEKTMLLLKNPFQIIYRV
jgi:hypothetical protein